MKEDDGQKKEYTEVGINGFAYDIHSHLQNPKQKSFYHTAGISCSALIKSEQHLHLLAF